MEYFFTGIINLISSLLFLLFTLGIIGIIILLLCSPPIDYRTDSSVLDDNIK